MPVTWSPRRCRSANTMSGSDMPPVPSLNFAGATAKINAAFEFGHGGPGGTQLLSQVLTDLVGIRFDGAAVVDFVGLQRAVHVLGGVDMCVDVRTVSQHTGAVFEPGCRLMKPAEVLDYLRQRRFPDGDFTRQIGRASCRERVSSVV